MRGQIGDEGTEQFTVTTRLNGEVLKAQPVHDPFATTTVRLRGWGHAWRALTRGIEVRISVDGSEGASRAIMTLDPVALQKDSEDILKGRAESRERNAKEGMMGYYAETKTA